MEDLLTANPEIDLVFAYSAQGGLGAYDAIQAAGRDGAISIIGFDASEEEQAAIAEKGCYKGSIIQFPDKLGQTCVESVTRVLNGETLDKEIGENGHIAFNDPHEADFNDDALVKIVTLDEKCRQQQVNDVCFSRLEDVPETALTLTIPALVAAPQVFCIVPARTKAAAVYDTVHGPVSETCPASVLRRPANAVLNLDPDSSSLLAPV